MAYDSTPREICSLESEQAVLGAILFDNAIYSRVADFLKREHFFDPVHQLIYMQVAEMIDIGRLASPVTVDVSLRASKGYQDAGGRTYLEQLAANVPSTAGAPDYARVVSDLAFRRSVEKEAAELALAMRDASLDFDARKLLDSFDEKVSSFFESGKSSRGKTMATAAAESLERMEAATRQDEAAPLGVRCGLSSIDDMLGGFRKGKLCIVAGRPGQGKSTLLNKLAAGIAEKEGAGVAFSTLEMEASDLPVMLVTDRLRDRCIRLPYIQAEKGIFSQEEWAAYEEELRFVAALPFRIDDAPAASLPHIRRFAREAKRKFAAEGRAFGALFVDYLGLIEKSRDLQGTEKVAEITQGLLALARELDAPVICGCQLNRQVENRDDKRPILPDLRESGDIEQDAFCVMFVFRELPYHERDEPKAGTPGSKEAARHEAWALERERLKVERPLEVIVAKHRRGPTGTVTLWCEIETAAIRDKGFNMMDPKGRDREGFL